MSIKVGIAGKRGLNYMPGFVDMEDVQVAAFCDISQDVCDLAKNEYGIPQTFRLFEDMISTDIDAVFVATPMHFHTPQNLLALNAGKHVLSEVTLGVSMDELFWMKKTVENSNQVFMMCENYCYRPDVVLIQKLIADGMFGELYYGEGEYIEDIRSWLSFADGSRSWRQYWQVGKRGSFYPTHCVGPLMKWFKGDHIDEVSCFGVGPYVAPEFRQEDTTITMLRLKSGKLVKVRVDVMSPRPNQNAYFQLQGTKGCIELPRGPLGQQGDPWAYFGDGKARISRGIQWNSLWDYADLLPENYRNMPEGAKKLAENGDYNTCGGDYYVVQDFIRAIRGEIESPVNIYEACEWSAVALLSELSAMNGGRPMKMPDFTDKNMKEAVIL